MKKQVLLIEDDDALRLSLAQTLDLEGIDVIPTAHFVQARRALRANFAGVVLTDIRMPDKDGFDILELAQSIDSELPVVMLTGEGDVPLAIRAMREGAYDFLEKPCDTSHLIEVLNRAMSHRALVLRNRRMEQRLRRSDPAIVNFPGESPASRELRDNLRLVAETERHVMLTGAQGVGRKLAAHTIFMLSEGRSNFETLRLPEINPNAFTLSNDALDLSVKNVDDASAAQKEKLISEILANPKVRAICSTVKPIPTLVEALDCHVISIPDLYERKSDVPVIFETLLRNAVRTQNMEMPELSQTFLADLEARKWPGHLSQLRDFANEFLADKRAVSIVPTLAEQMDRFEQSVLENALRKHQGKAAQVAEELGLPRKTLYDRLARYGLRPRAFQ